MDVKTKTLKLATALTFNMVRRICLTVSMRFSRGLNRHSWTRRLSGGCKTNEREGPGAPAPGPSVGSPATE